jgi:hydrogenase-4 component B
LLYWLPHFSILFNLSIIILITTLLFIATLLALKEKLKGYVAVIAVAVNSVLSGWIAVQAISGVSFSEIYYGGYIFGDIPIRVDALSGWFLLLMNFTMCTGILYGRHYMKPYENQPVNISLHYASYIMIHFAMIGIYSVQNSLAFLCVWELMAISSFLLIIFEHWKIETLKAGINFLVQSHIGIVFLMIGFIWTGSHTGSYDFNAISRYSASVSAPVSFLLFLCFFIAFGIKAGFVPFHTWLPYAHPVAPAHISGVMSGVIIKLGIFGILRMILLINGNHLVIGYTILVISVISGVYGVMLAIIQHNIKKLLAYHSIENIGIIGIGIGIGTIGIGMGNSWLAFAGFAGALLHTLNHSLFKSLLFYCAGTLYQATHRLDIEQFGGLIKKLPQTAVLFLIASLAICGLPPFNGFISEFLIYSGLFDAIHTNALPLKITMVLAIFGLVIIGGLAMLCFTKAFGIIFLGNERHPYPEPVTETGFSRLFPKYIAAGMIILIGIVPQWFIYFITNPVQLFTGQLSAVPQGTNFIAMLQQVSLAVCSFIFLALLIFWIRKIAVAGKQTATAPTWGCGYEAPSPKLQYTANSFVRSYRKLVRPLLIMNKKENDLAGIFPNPVHSETQPYDKLEAVLIDIPIKHIRGFMGRFRFLQNGNPQYYILYGIIFIILVITLPLLIDGFNYVYELIRQI